MTLAAGVRLGPYEIVAPLGAGGMGEVYKARDTRLGRTVAIKILPEHASSDPERLRRFEQEARAASAVHHPNICVLHDIGESLLPHPAGLERTAGTASRGELRVPSPVSVKYLVMEYLEGQTLAQRLRTGALPYAQALELGAQVADGLAAAHRQGIVHRDLKPGNIILVKGGGGLQVKLLDFGLAKLTLRAGGSEGGESTRSAAAPATSPGTLMGTMPYMAPEQLEGKATDARTDLFAFGCVLFEMLTGRRAFTGDSEASLVSEIMTSEPPPVAAVQPLATPALERLVKACLAKDPDARRQHAADVAEELRGVWEDLSPTIPDHAPAPGRSFRVLVQRAVLALAVCAVAGLAATLAYMAGRHFGAAPLPSFERLSFRRGWANAARFSGDGHSIVYSAAWDGGPNEIYSLRLGRPESQRLGHAPAELLAVSSTGWLAINRNSGPRKMTLFWSGTLAQVPEAGGSPRDLAQHVSFADWSPDGKELAIVRETGTVDQLEYPVGNVLVSGYALRCARVSPTGNLVAFIEASSVFWEGAVAVVDRQGRKTSLTGNFRGGADGLAWSPSGEEIWFTAGEERSNKMALRAVTLDRRERVIYRESGSIRLLDVARDGRVLVTRDDTRTRAFFHEGHEKADRELSWLDGSGVDDLSSDGRTVVIDEAGEGAGSDAAQVFLRDTAGKEPTYLGPGFGFFSPDRQVVVAAAGSPPAIVFYPIGSGQPHRVRVEGVHLAAVWGVLPDNRTVVFHGNEPSRGERIWNIDRSGSKPRPITPEGVQVVRPRPISPDGQFVLAIAAAKGGAQKTVMAYPIAGGEPWPIKGLLVGDLVAGWGPEGSWLFAFRPFPLPGKLFKVDLGTGVRTLLHEIAPPDPAGRLFAFWAVTTPDGHSYAYSTAISRSELYLVDGLR